MTTSKDTALNHGATPRPTVGQLAVWGKGTIETSRATLNRRIGFVWTDSRKVGPGDIFVAVKTPRDDGHRYVADALAAGALAAIVDRRSTSMFTPRQLKRLIRVNDPVTALQKMGAAYRRELGILFIGVTGSNGKTTTRSFLGSVLGEFFPLTQTYSNWNNHIGVPMSILRFAGDEWIGLIEMGANHLHEIHTLSTITRPDIAIITNIGYAHVGLFGSLSGTTRAKFEIADGLNPDGFLLLNGDDHRLVSHARTLKRTCYFFGTSKSCDIRARNITMSRDYRMRFTVDETDFELPLPGRHFVYSALPAIFLARRFGITEQDIVNAVGRLSAAEMRGVIQNRAGARFIVDCYNANPSSMAGAVELLADLAPKEKRVAVVGDMLELGRYSTRLHQALGRKLRDAQVDRVIAVGEFADRVRQGMGTEADRVVTVADARAAADAAGRLVRPGDTVLLKGSRSVGLEIVYERFTHRRGKKS